VGESRTLLITSINNKGIKDTVAVCMGTDGIDGMSPAAGAIIDDNTIQEALAMGLNPIEYLETMIAIRSFHS